MANGTDTYDYTTDPAFLQAPPEQQHSYLAANDPDYAKATPEQQQAYRGHLSQHIPTGSEAASVPPTEPMPQKPSSMRGSGGSSPTRGMHQVGLALGDEEPDIMGTPIAPMGAAASYPRAVWGLLAGYGANKIAGEFTQNPWIKDAATIGAGALGEGVGAAAEDTIGKFGIEKPNKIPLPGGFKVTTPWTKAEPTMEEEAAAASQRKLAQRNADIEAGVTQHPGVPAHAEMEADIAKGQQSRAAAKNEMDQEIAEGHQFRVGANNEMNQDIMEGRQGRAAVKNEMDQEIAEGHQFRVGANNEMNQDIMEGRQGRAAARDVAHNDLAQARMNRGREQERIDAGTATEGSSQKVTKIPEPNPVPPGENPNNQQSVPRRTTLVQNAKRGKEGAGLQLNQIHGPVLYEPKGTGYGGPRQWNPEETVGGGGPIVPPKTTPGLRNPTEVMAQPTATTRATPTGEATLFGGDNGKLPAELHSDLEKQAGRPLSNEEASAIDRANKENDMATGNNLGLKYETDKNGIKWAVDPQGVRVSIPKRITGAGDVEAYARQKIAEQIQMRKDLPK